MYRFNIEAVAACRITRGQMKLIHVPDAKLDKKKLAVKNRILRYLRFKDNLKIMALQQKFVLPDRFGISFFIYREGTKVGSHDRPDITRHDYIQGLMDMKALGIQDRIINNGDKLI